jgi:hypothetical protein
VQKGVERKDFTILRFVAILAFLVTHIATAV